MCCGYYEKIKSGGINLNSFYNKRYLKILPFFLLLTVADLFASLVFGFGISAGAIFEAFANSTLMFGFYATQNMTVIGVGWTLGVIFGFYILFPFFVYMIWTRLRAWIALGVTVAVSLISNIYFGAERTLVFPWMCYFIAGGLIYLYREELSKIVKNIWIGLAFIACGFVLVIIVTSALESTPAAIITTFRYLLGFSMMVIGCLCKDCPVLDNPASRFLSNISFEIYLAHMMVFRVLEKLGVTSVAGDTVISYAATALLTFAGSVVLATVYKYIEGKIETVIKTKIKEKQAIAS